jgi:hypothetical protein
MIEVGAARLACVMNVIIAVSGFEAVALKLHTLASDAPASASNHLEDSGI